MTYKGSFAGKVLGAALRLGEKGLEFRASDILEEIGGGRLSDKKKTTSELVQLTRIGVIERVSKGLYRWKGAKPQGPSKWEKMNIKLRAALLVSADDLIEVSGAAEGYVKEFLRIHEKYGAVKQVSPGMWRMIKDLGPGFRPDDNAEKCRRLRAKRKAALESLDNAVNALLEERMGISEIPEYFHKE